MTRPTPHTCRDAFLRLHDYLDRELAPEDLRRVREHLDACVRCAREFRFEAAVLDALRVALRRVELPAGLRARVATALRDAAGP